MMTRATDDRRYTSMLARWTCISDRDNPVSELQSSLFQELELTENSSRGIITGKTGLAHAGAIVMSATLFLRNRGLQCEFCWQSGNNVGKLWMM